MNPASISTACRCVGTVTVNDALTADLHLLKVRTDADADFLPGQFAMLNINGAAELVFNRPLSILAAHDGIWSFLFRVVGRGTSLLARAEVGSQLSLLAPLGTPFPEPEPGQRDILIAGGVGLPPLLAWHERFGGRDTPAFFGARDGGDVPWRLLSSEWRIGLEQPTGVPADHVVEAGLVTEICRARLAAEKASTAGSHRLLACGPLPMLRAVVVLAQENVWPCMVSLEEHMGCGFGACRGCVVPRAGGGWLVACSDGPVVDAGEIDWDAFGRKGVADVEA